MSAPIRVGYLKVAGADAPAALGGSGPKLDVRPESDPDRLLDAVRAGDVDCVVASEAASTADPVAVLERVLAEDEALPTFLLTDAAGGEAARAALAMGVTDVLQTEPDRTGADLLVTRIERAVDRRRDYDSLQRCSEMLDDAETITEFGVADYDARTDEVWLSDGMYRQFGLERPPRGNTFEATTPEDSLPLYFEADRETVSAAYDRALDDGERSDVEVRTADGDAWVRLQCQPQFDDEDSVVGFRAIVRDITDRRCRVQELGTYESIVQAIPDELVVVDSEGDIERVIPPVGDDRTISGHRPEELVGVSAAEVMQDGDLERSIELVEELVTTDRDHGAFEMQVETKDGELLWREDHVALLEAEDGSIRGTVSILRDIDDRIARERELERYETLLDLMPDTVVVTDLEGSVTEIHGFEGWSGYDYDELVDSHMSFNMTPESVERAESVVADLILSDERDKDTFEAEIEMADGHRIPWEDHITLLPPDENGEIPGTMSVLRNIEERKQRERQLERYAKLVEASGDAVYALDSEGRFTFSNEAHQEIVDRPESEILDSHASFALPDEAVEDGSELISELLAEGRRHGTFEMDVLRPDGERIPTENHLALLTDEDGQFRGSVGVLRNISDRLDRERELERQNDRLEEFASIASHDLRNPLNLAQGHLAFVVEDCESEHTEQIDRALDRMQQLIEDTLTWAKQGATVSEWEHIALGDLARACSGAVGGEPRLTVMEPVAVSGDPGRVRQLLDNLLRNAVEHAGPYPEVRIGPLAGGFYVEDDGPGIPPGDRETVFTTGYSTAPDGTGFGLAIVGEIAEAHGWQVAVSEGSQGGARFEFTDVDRPTQSAESDR